MTDKKSSIELVPYNADWPQIFEQEALQIQKALDNYCIALHHVGSTAVPGLSAKPTIDIIGVVKNRSETIHLLEKIDFEYMGEYTIPGHFGFRKRNSVKVNLHVYEPAHPEIELNLLFRDYLRAHSEAREAYAKLKLHLVNLPCSSEKQNSLFKGYTLGKDEFIRSILKQAGFQKLRMRICAHHAEWTASQHFRQKYFFDKVPIADPYTWTFDHPQHAHLIFYQGVDIIGYAHVQFWPDKRAALRIIVIDENQRRKGLGKQFLKYIEQWLKQKNYTSLHTESSPDAFAFYKAQGYIDMPFNDPDGYESDPKDLPLGKVL